MEEKSIKQLLHHYIPDTVKITAPLVGEITTLLLRVLFCLDDATAFPRFFVRKGYFRLARDARPLKNSFLSNGYMLKNCKFFVHAVAVGQAQPNEYSKFGVLREDARLLLDCAQLGGVITYCRDKNKDFKYVPMRVFETALSEELNNPKLVTFMNKFLHKKLKFVMNSQGLSPYDIKTEFISHSIVRVYRTYPRIENRIHLRNLLRQVIHARGQSMIVETAKSKRSNLIRLSNGEFQGRLAPFHLIPKEMLDANKDNLACSITGGTGSSEEDWLFQQDLDKMIRQHSTSVCRHRFLVAVFNAKKDPEFISYLRCRIPDKFGGVQEDEISQVMMEYQPQDFVTHAIEFSHLDPIEAIELLRSIKEECLQ